MKNKIQLVIFIMTINTYGFEVNTHQALTRCAITKECNKNGGTKNLDAFVKNAELPKYNDYDELIFEKYKAKKTGSNITYQDYILGEEEAIYNYKVKVNGDYKGMIEAGVILEDAVHHNALFGGDGRFNNHFYAAQLNSKENCTQESLATTSVLALMGRPKLAAVAGTVTLGNTALMKTNKALCLGFGARTDNIDWALNKNVDLSLDIEFNKKAYGLTHRTNDYGLDDAFSYFRKSFIGSVANRKKYQAKLFASLGFMVHLIQDLHSPAHCRDNSHPKGDYLEMYGRVKGGFFLRDGSFSHGLNNPHITQAIAKMDMKQEMLKNNRFVSYEDFFKKEAEWVSKNFFSESHIPTWSVLGTQSIFGGGTTINNATDVDSIFDDNPLPSKDTTYENEKDQIVSTGNTVSYIHGNLVSFDGLNEKPIGLIDRGVFFDDEHIILPTYKMDYRKNRLVPGSANTSALEFTSVNVMPRAVASTQAFINFFFRGQMETSLSDDHTKLIVKNVSDNRLVYSPRLLTFKSGGKFSLYYEQNGINNLIGTYTLYGNIAKGNSHTIDIGTIIDDKNLPNGTKITVIYDGNIGDSLGGYDDYGIGMRGLSADVFEFVKGECRDKELGKQLKLTKYWIMDRNDCVMFAFLNQNSNRKNIYSRNNHSCYKYYQHYKNTQLGGVISSRGTSYFYADKLIDYFNYKVYHLNTDSESPNEHYSARASRSPYYLPTSGNFNVSYNITQIKDGSEVRNITLNNLLYYNYKPANEHINAPHYHVTCHANSRICNYLKMKNVSDYFIELTRTNIAAQDFLSSPYNPSRVADRIGSALADYYGKDYGKSYTNNKYPKDWLKRIVDWIEMTDCSSRNRKVNIFYDEKRIEKSQNLQEL